MMDRQWHVWTITANCYNKIKEFLSNISQIKDIIYPIVEKQIETKSGKKIKRDVSLYANYIFLQYENTAKVATLIEHCPWVCNYIGKCSQEEINRVKALDSRRYEDLILGGDLYVGKQIKMMKTAFKDMIASIVKIEGNKLVVSISLFGAERFIKCSINDVDIGD